MVTKLQYAAPVSAQRVSTSQPKTINYPAIKKQKKQERERIKKIKSQAKSKEKNIKKAYEEALKELPSKNVPYEERAERFDEWYKKNQSILTHPENVEKTKQLLAKESKIQDRASRKDFEKITAEYSPSGDYETRIKEFKKFVEQNQDILTQRNNYERTQQLIAQEKAKLSQYEEKMPIRSAQQFNPNQYISYDWETNTAKVKNPERYNIEYYPSGKIKSIKEKEKRYTREEREKKGKRDKKEYDYYTPKEIYFDEQGNIKREVEYKLYVPYDKSWDDGSVTRTKVFKASEKTYNPSGTLKSVKKWDDYDEKREKDDDRRFSREAVYLEEEQLYDEKGNLISKKEWDDLQTEYDKFKDGYERERDVYLEQEYDYLKGMKKTYPGPDQEFRTFGITQDEFKEAKDVGGDYVKYDKDTLITPEGKRISSINENWLKEQQEKRGGQIIEKGIYSTKESQKEKRAIERLSALKPGTTGYEMQLREIAQLRGQKYSEMPAVKEQQMIENINKLVKEKGGREGITAGELSGAAGGLGNLMGRDELLKSISEIDKDNRKYAKSLEKAQKELTKGQTPGMIDYRKESVFTQTPTYRDGEMVYEDQRLTPKETTLLSMGEQKPLEYARDLNRLAETESKVRYLSSQPEYKNFVTKYFKDEKTRKATERKLQKGTDERFLTQYQKDYDKLNQAELAQMDVYSSAAQEQSKSLEKMQREMEKERVKRLGAQNRYQVLTQRLDKLSTRSAEEGWTATKTIQEKRKLEREREKIAQELVEYDTLLPARQDQKTSFEKIAGEVVTLGREEKPKTLGEKQKEFIEKKSQSEWSLAASATPIYRSTFGNVGKGLEKIGYGLKDYGQDLQKDADIRAKRAEGMMASADIFRQTGRKLPGIRPAEKSYYEQFTEDTIRRTEGAAKLTNIQAKLKRGTGKTSEFIGGMFVGAGKEYRTKPWKTFFEVGTGLLFGAGAKAAPAIGAGIREVAGARTLMFAKGGAKTGLYVMGAQYAAGSGLRIAAAPKDKKAEAIGVTVKELGMMGLGASAGSQLAKYYKPRLDLFEKKATVRYRMRVEQPIFKVQSPVKAKVRKTKLLDAKSTIRPFVRFEAQAPGKINRLGPKEKQLYEQMIETSKFAETKPGVVRKQEGAMRRKTQQEYLGEVAGYSDIKFSKFLETGKKLPKKYMEPYILEQTAMPNKVVARKGTTSGLGEIKKVEADIIKSDIGYYKGEPIKATKITENIIGGKQTKKTVTYKGMYNKDLKLQMEISPEGQILRKGKQIVDVQAAEPKNMFALEPATTKVATSTETGLKVQPRKTYAFEQALMERKRQFKLEPYKPDVIKDVFMQYGKERLPGKIGEAPGDFLLLTSKKVPIKDLKIKQVGSKTIQGEKVFIFETTKGKRIEIPETMVQDKMISAEYINKKIAPFTRDVKGDFKYFEIKSPGQKEFTIFGTKTRTDIRAAQARATMTPEKMGPIEAEMYRRTGETGFKQGEIFYTESKAPTGDLFGQGYSGIKVKEVVMPAKIGKGGRSILQIKRTAGEDIKIIGNEAISQPYKITQVLKTAKPGEPVVSAKTGFESYVFDTGQTGYKKLAVIKDGKVSLKFREYKQRPSKKLKNMYEDIMQRETKPQTFNVFEKGKLDKKSFELFEAISKPKEKTTARETGSPETVQVQESISDRARQTKKPKTKQKEITKKQAKQARDVLSESTISKPAARQRARGRQEQYYSDMAAPGFWSSLRGEERFMQERSPQQKFNPIEDLARANRTITEPKIKTKRKLRYSSKMKMAPELLKSVRSEYTEDTLNRIDQTTEPFQKTKPIQRTDQSILQEQKSQSLQRLTSVSGGYGFSGFTPSAPVPPKPPKPIKPKKPKILPFRFKKEKQKKSTKKLTKDYTEREFSVLDLLNTKQRSKKLAFI